MRKHALSDEEKEDLADYKAKYNYAEWSTEEINKELLRHWLHYFKENRDFEDYCEAKRNNDKAACKKLERKFVRISELYEDWGDIHALPSMVDSEGKNWGKWLAKKSHLFFESPITLHSVPPKNIHGTDLLISIPSTASKNYLEKLFKEFLNKHEELIDIPIKYPFNVIRAESKATTLKRLDQASMVIDLLSMDEDEYSKDPESKFSHAQIAALILKLPILQYEFGWFDDGKSSVYKGPDHISTNKVINSCKRKIINLMHFHRACIENTINGEFPSVITKGSSAQKKKKLNISKPSKK